MSYRLPNVSVSTTWSRFLHFPLLWPHGRNMKDRFKDCSPPGERDKLREGTEIEREIDMYIEYIVDRDGEIVY